MRKIVLFMHVSLDGFVAGPNGEMDWINVDADMFEYAGQQTDQADMALYGRVTYEMMENYWPTAGDQPGASKHDKQHSTWYNKVDKIVLSKTMRGTSLNKVHVIAENVTGEIIKFKQVPGENILIFGSPTASHSLMADDLIDDYWLFINPILLSQGIPLFKDIKEQRKLKLISSNTFKSGVVCLHYEQS